MIEAFSKSIWCFLEISIVSFLDFLWRFETVLYETITRTQLKQACPIFFQNISMKYSTKLPSCQKFPLSVEESEKWSNRRFRMPFMQNLCTIYASWHEKQMNILCSYDYLKISNEKSQSFGEYCGNKTGKTVSVTGDFAVIRFQSVTGGGRGFRLSFGMKKNGSEPTTIGTWIWIYETYIWTAGNRKGQKDPCSFLHNLSTCEKKA